LGGGGFLTYLTDGGGPPICVTRGGGWLIYATEKGGVPICLAICFVFTEGIAR